MKELRELLFPLQMDTSYVEKVKIEMTRIAHAKDKKHPEHKENTFYLI